MTENQGEIVITKEVSLLPNIRKFREVFPPVYDDEDGLNLIFNWWRDVNNKANYFSRFQKAVESEKLPALEKKGAKDLYRETVSEFSSINDKINSDNCFLRSSTRSKTGGTFRHRASSKNRPMGFQGNYRTFPIPEVKLSF